MSSPNNHTDAPADPLVEHMLRRVREVFPDAELVSVTKGKDRAMTPYERRRLRK